MPAKKAKTTKKAVRKSTGEVSPTGAAAGILFAGAAVIFLGMMQSRENIELLLVGFGAALLVLGGVIVGMATNPLKKR